MRTKAEVGGRLLHVSLQTEEAPHGESVADRFHQSGVIDFVVDPSQTTVGSAVYIPGDTAPFCGPSQPLHCPA